jgi:hypothetical protein
VVATGSLTDGKYLYQPSEAFRPKVSCKMSVSDKQLAAFPSCEIIHPLSEILNSRDYENYCTFYVVKSDMNLQMLRRNQILPFTGQNNFILPGIRGPSVA